MATLTSSSPDISSSNAFTEGDLVLSVSGDGDGSGTYADNQASPITLVEVTTTGDQQGQLVLPQASGTNTLGQTVNPISGEYGSSSEGTLQLSADGHSLVIGGYDINAATFNAGEAGIADSGEGGTYGNEALAQTTSVPGGPYPAVAREAANISASGQVDDSTALFNVFNTNNIRSVATVDGTSFYVSGQGVKGDTTQGVFFAQDGATSGTAVDTSTDTRTVEIINGDLYVSRDSKQGSGGTKYTANIGSYGGEPTTATGYTILPGISQSIVLTAAQSNGTNNSQVGKTVDLSPENFFFANATTLYVADGGSPKGGGLGDGGLQKWSFNGTSWMLDYTMATGLNLVANTSTSGTTGLIGLTGEVAGNTVELFATNSTVGDTDQTYLYGITDQLNATTLPANESFTVLDTAAPDTNIRGVAFAPTPGVVQQTYDVPDGQTVAPGKIADVSVGDATEVIKSGAGVLQLASSNTYSGGTILSAGVLQVDVATVTNGTGGIVSSAIGIGALNFDGGVLQAGATVSLANAVNLTEGIVGTLDSKGHVLSLSGVISGAGALSVENTSAAIGTIELTNANTYTGGTTISSGVLELDTATAAGTGAITYEGTMAVLQLAAGVDPGNTLDGLTLGNEIALLGEAAMSATITPGNKLVVTEEGGTLTLQLNPDQSFANEQFVVSSSGGNSFLTLESAMSTVQIVTEGTPTTPNSLGLALSTANGGTPTTGVFLLNVTEANPPTNIAAAAGGLILDGAGFALTGNGTAAALRVNVANGAGAPTAANADAVTIENLNIANTGTANAIADAGAVTFSNDGAAGQGAAIYTISAPIAGLGSVAVTENGATMTHVVFSGANTYTGATTISAGADLILGAGGSIANSASVALTGTGMLDASNTTAAGGTTTVSLNDLSSAANSTVLIGQNTLSLTENAGAVAGAAAVPETFAGVISGGATGNLVLQSGVLELTGANTYAGSTRISGTLELGAADAIADSANVALKASGAVLDTSRVGGAVTINQLTGVTGSSIVLGTGNGAGVNSSLVVNENVASATFNGVISSTAAGVNDALTVEGGNVLTLTGANTYAGVTNIDAGSGIALSGSGTLGLGEANVGGTLDLSGVTGGTVTLNGLADGVTTAGAPADGSVNLGSTNLVEVAGTTFDGTISGTTGALQVGAPAAGTAAASTPTFTLTGVETYTGSTRIYGTLDITGTGSIASSANIALKAAGAELDVSGATGTAANINGDNLNAVTINQLTGQPGSTIAIGTHNLIVMESGAGTFDGAVTGSGDFVVRGPGTLTLNETAAAGAPAQDAFEGTLVVGGHVSLTGATQFADSNLADNGNVSIASATVAAGAAVEVGGLQGIAGSNLTLGSNTLDVMGSIESADAYAGVISGAGGLTIGNDVFFTLNGANTYTGVTTTTARGDEEGGGVLYVDGGSLASTSIVNNGDVGFTSTTFGGVISGAGAVFVRADSTSANPETVVFSGVNTYTGLTEVGGDPADGTAPAQTGVLQIASGGSIATSSGVTLFGYGALDLSRAGAQTLQSLASYNGVASAGAANTNSVILGTSNLTIGSGLQTGSTNANTDMFDGVISGGNGQLIIAPSETIIFSAAQAYTGSTVIQGEVELTGLASLASSANVSLKATAATAAGMGTTPTPATIAADGVLDISGVTTSTTTINNLTGQAGTDIVLGANTLVVNETVAGAFSGAIGATGGGDAGGLTVTGSAYLTLSGASTYTGETLIDGSLQLGSSTTTMANGNTTTTTTTPGTLDSGMIVDDGFFAISADSTVNDFQGTGVLKTMGHTLSDTMNANETFSGVIHGTAGVLSLTSTNAETLTLSGSSDFTGGIHLNDAASVHLSALNAAGTGAITFEAGATGTLSIDNAALTGGGTATESFANTIAGSATAGAAATVDLTDLTFNSASSSQSFTVSSTGTFTITEGATSVTLHTDMTGGTVTAMSDSHGGTSFHFV